MDRVDQMQYGAFRRQMYALFGNSLLRPLGKEAANLLDASFWLSFPLDASNERIESGITGLANACNKIASNQGDDAVDALAIEYTRLFIGPGTPLAPPWESLYVGCNEKSCADDGSGDAAGSAGSAVLFGRPTFEVKEMMRKRGLSLGPDIHQLEDHIAVEMLCLAASIEGLEVSGVTRDVIEGDLNFIEQHPLSWIEPLTRRVQATEEYGFYGSLLELCWGFMIDDVAILGEITSSLEAGADAR